MLFSYTHNIDDDDRVLQRVIRFEIWLKLRDEVHLCVADGADN